MGSVNPFAATDSITTGFPGSCFLSGSERAGEKVVAAGVQHHQINVPSGMLHLGEDETGVKHLAAHLILVVYLGVNRQQIVGYLHL